MNYIVWGILWAYVCHRMAIKRGRDPLLGALLGFLFGIFSVIGYALAGRKHEQD